MELSDRRSLVALVVVLALGVAVGGGVYYLVTNAGSADRVLSIEAVPLDADGNASFVLRTDEGTNHIETEPAGAAIGYPESVDYTSLDVRQLPAVRFAAAGLEEIGVASLVRNASRTGRVQSTSVAGTEAARIESTLSSIGDGPFVVYLETDRGAVYLQYSITETP